MTLNKNIILFKKLLQPIVLPAIVVLFTFLNSLTVNNIVGKKNLGLQLQVYQIRIRLAS